MKALIPIIIFQYLYHRINISNDLANYIKNKSWWPKLKVIFMNNRRNRTKKIAWRNNEKTKCAIVLCGPHFWLYAWAYVKNGHANNISSRDDTIPFCSFVTVKLFHSIKRWKCMMIYRFTMTNDTLGNYY